MRWAPQIRRFLLLEKLRNPIAGQSLPKGFLRSGPSSCQTAVRLHNVLDFANIVKYIMSNGICAHLLSTQTTD